MRKPRKPILTGATMKAIGLAFEPHKRGVVTTPEFVLFTNPNDPRGYTLVRRNIGVPNN